MIAHASGQPAMRIARARIRARQISLKRVYEAPDASDGVRILVDRLWPRGLARESAGIDVWLKSIAPSDALRKWYGHDVEKWPEFRQRYFAELDAGQDALNELRSRLGKGKVTLLYAASETEHNNAVALKEYLSLYPQ